MNENKRVTFRLNEEEIEKFKAFSEEQGINQAEAFAKLIEAMELSKAKAIVSDRAKEIESIESHLNAIQSIYLTALEINQNAETVIKENYSKELNSKDSIIIELQDKNKAFKEQVEQIKEVTKVNSELNKVVEDINKQLMDKIEEVKKINESNSTLNGIVAEYKEFKVINIELEKTNKNLVEGITDAKTTIKDLNNKFGATQKELSNIKEFYQQEIKELKSDNKQTLADGRKSYEDSIKELKQEHKETIKDIKVDHKSEITDIKKSYDGVIKELKAETKEEIQNIKSAKDIIIENLRKEIEQLRAVPKEK